MDIEIDSASTFTTTSLALTGFLFACSARFLGIERQDGVVHFQFSECVDLVQSYYSGGPVVATDYWAGLQRAKDLIYAK